jgi:CHASE2 domain-containing sensor protein
MSAASFGLHLATVAAVAGFLVWLWARASNNPSRTGLLTAALIAGWLAISAALALSGFTARIDILPPGAASVLVPALLV